MLTADGYIYRDGDLVRGHAFFSGGSAETAEGPLAGNADFRGLIAPGLVDCHTHCADAGVRPRPGMTLEELVAPPYGLKHRYLGETPEGTLIADMGRFGKDALSNGITSFIDFREGGAEGCRMLRSAKTQAMILGRPVSPDFDAAEIDGLLKVADGIAVSSVSDMPPKYAEAVADACRKAGRAFALHVSERVREDMDLVLSLQPSFVVHMTEAADADLRRCADADIPIVICPRSNGYFGKIPPIDRMADAGADVALGTDNAMLCTPDMRPEALAAMTVMERRGHDPSYVWHCLFDVPGKILKRVRAYMGNEEEKPPVAVMPFTGDDPVDALRSDRPVFLLRQ